MGSVNINRSVDDVFYRYKMPRLIAKVEGKGNGIKTVIANMSEIAKALNRPPTYPTKYFGCELGAQTQFDFKNERFIVNGEHDAQKLQELLDGFIKRFVLCTECENPETNLTVSKQQILQSCKACGYAGTIDPKLRLSTYILKNPPTEDGTGTINAAVLLAAQSKKARKGGKGAAKDKNSPTSETKDDDGSDEFDAPTNGHENGSDEGDWGDDVDGGDVEKPRLSGAMAGLTMNEDLDKTVSERLDMFYKYLQQEKHEGAMDGKKLLNEAKRLDIKEKAVLLLCRVLFDKDVVSEIKPNRMILLLFCHGDHRAQKYLLGGIEQLIEQRKDELLPKTARIFKEFYDNDLLDEEVLVEWGEKVSKKYVSKEMSKKIHEKADPFIKWLREAEEESEDEDEVEVAFDAGTVKPQLQRPAAKEANAGAQMNGKGPATGDEDELDIDDI